MKTEIEKYIKQHREALDVDTPPAELWNNIEATLKPKKQKKRGAWYWTKIAAGIVLPLGATWWIYTANKTPDNNELVAEVTGFDYTDPNNGGFEKAPIEEQETLLPLHTKTEALTAPLGHDLNSSGTYTVTVTDGNGCATTGLATQQANGQSGNFWAAGGTLGSNPYTYTWDFGGANKPTGDVSQWRGRLNESADSLLLSGEELNTERYAPIYENPFVKVAEEEVSTFSIDVDRASYSNSRRYLNNNQLPPADAVRLEEFINYFKYNYEAPSRTAEDPFAVHTELAKCPWNSESYLLHIGLQGKEIAKQNLPSNNLVFLIDVSGSMESPEKLALLKKGFGLLVDELREQDRVSIVVYAGAAGVVLPSTSGMHKDQIMDAINNLSAGGSTAGGEGIELAYKIAQENYMKNGNNRVILATDGDFNVGVSSDADLVDLIEHKRESGVFLSVMGFGQGNYQDEKMEKLADNGNGNLAYIDNIMEARKVLVTEMGGTLTTIAKDVKLQLEFNPEQVQSYRLIGYENRLLAREDFDDDTKDAGEMGAGHTVTALYEIVPVKANSLQDWVANVNLRYKAPNASKSKLISYTVNEVKQGNPSQNFTWSATVASFGMLLRNSQYKGNATYDKVLKLASISKGTDAEGYRSEFIKLVKKARDLSLPK